MNTATARPRPLRIALVVAILLCAVLAIVLAVSWALSAGREDPASTGPERVTSSSERSPDAPADLPWPSSGTAAIAVGDGAVEASSDEATPMASISKLATALMILDARPLSPGERGGDYWFTQAWDDAYQDYLARGESALKIPVGGMLTEYQLLQGMLIGSACNYADILVTSIWGDDDAFAAAAAAFLPAHGLDGITMVEPTGIDPRNTATPAALIALGRLAMQNSVIAEIVAMPEVELPGAGHVDNTNDLLADPGVVGIKTGTLDGSNLLSAKDVPRPDGSVVRVFAVVMGQPDDEARFTQSRALYAAVQQRLSQG